MTSFIVLAKLVPDIRHIPADAWDLKRGTLRRNKLRLVPNPMDDRALLLSLRLRDAWGGTVTVLSMGPPSAEEICLRALAFGADRAVLVSDPACAGADTLATSIVLARAVERVAHDPRRVVVLAGMQSPDGDTAQVPVQVGAMLNAAVVPYVTNAEIQPGTVALTSIGSVGSSTTGLTGEDLPAVITCTDQLPTLPFHTSLSGLRKAVETGVEVMTGRELGLPPEQTGLAGSATRVVTISVAESVRRETEFVDWSSRSGRNSGSEIVSRLAQALGSGTPASAEPGGRIAASGLETEHDQSVEPARKPRRTGPAGSVWALVETMPDGERLGILHHARQIADRMGCAATAVTITDAEGERGDEAVRMLHHLGRAGATDHLAVQRAGSLDPVGVGMAMVAAAREFTPHVILLPASPEGRVSAPYLAARMNAGLTADCTDFEVKDYRTRHDGERRTFKDALFQKRPALGGNIEATIVSPVNIANGVPQLATVRPGPTVPVSQPVAVETHLWAIPDKARYGGGTHRPGLGPAGDETRPASGDRTPGVQIERCKVLVSVGRGVGGSTRIAEVAQPFADAIRDLFDVDVEISASRMVVDEGSLGRERQVGQTGKVVAPDVYIALGISGAAQHRAGMEGSSTIIAVNTDEDAPIRHISDVFVHGRVEDVVPALVAAMEEYRG